MVILRPRKHFSLGLLLGGLTVLTSACGGTRISSPGAIATDESGDPSDAILDEEFAPPLILDTAAEADAGGLDELPEEALNEGPVAASAAVLVLPLQNHQSGAVAQWKIDTAGARVGEAFPTLRKADHPELGALRLITAADFNRDQIDDLLFWNPESRRLTLWLMNDAHQVQAKQEIAERLPGSYRPIAAPDLNGDQWPDVVLQNNEGDVIAWMLDEHQDRVRRVALVERNKVSRLHYFSLMTTADLNADGFADLIFQTSQQTISVVLMKNGKATRPRLLASAKTNFARLPDFSLRAARDLNGDGRVDLIFQNRHTGKILFWYLQKGLQKARSVRLQVPENLQSPAALRPWIVSGRKRLPPPLRYPNGSVHPLVTPSCKDAAGIQAAIDVGLKYLDCRNKGTIAIRNTVKFHGNGFTLDAAGTTFQWTGEGTCSDAEGQKPIFMFVGNANVLIGATIRNAADGIWLYKGIGNTLDRISLPAICEDGVTNGGRIAQPATGSVIKRSTFKNAADKAIQVNGGSLTVDSNTFEGVGKALATGGSEASEWNWDFDLEQYVPGVVQPKTITFRGNAVTCNDGGIGMRVKGSLSASGNSFRNCEATIVKE